MSMTKTQADAALIAHVTLAAWMRLTPRQQEVVLLIWAYTDSHGYSPTMQELAELLDCTKVTIFEHIKSAEKKGVLARRPHQARGLLIVKGTEQSEVGRLREIIKRAHGKLMDDKVAEAREILRGA